jgi:hypothetical protein
MQPHVQEAAMSSRRMFLRKAAGTGLAVAVSRAWANAVAAEFADLDDPPPAELADGEPIDPLAIPIVQGLVHNGKDSPTGRYDEPEFQYEASQGKLPGFFNRRLPFRWQRRGGDWRDAEGVRHSLAHPFVTFRVLPQANGAGPAEYTFDATELFQKWQEEEDREGSMFLRCIAGSYSAPQFYAKGHEHAPIASITTVEGDVIPLACRASVYLYRDSSSQGPNATYFTFNRDGHTNAIVQFDRGPLIGRSIAAATVTFRLKSMPGTTSTTVGVFETAPPLIITSRMGAPIEGGIAQGYPWDQGLAGHPQVVATWDYADLVAKRSGGRVFDEVSRPSQGWQQLPNELTGGATTMLRRHFPPAEAGQTTGVILGSGTVERYIQDGVIVDKSLPRTDPRNAGIPVNPRQRLNYRYMLRLRPGWGGLRGSVKMPGLSMQYGFLTRYDTPFPTWQQTHGNAGAKGTGKYSYNGTSYNGGYSYAGHATKLHIERGGHADDYYANVEGGLYSLRLFMGHNHRYGEGDDASIYHCDILMFIDDWTCVELEQHMNSIDTSVLDQYGNGNGRRDGIVRLYVNGVLRYQRTNLCWNHHPAYGIEGVFDQGYHGGKVPLSNPGPLVEPFDMDLNVLAETYIGLPGGFQPTMIPMPQYW